ncbi:MAG TPA: hypothetical protein VE197_18560, partial [Mycobacterium sp.]|nr:hypothetical protein [Mycobacterium sp.]
PDPDLVRVKVDDAWLNRVKESIPELPLAKRARYVAEFGLPAYDAGVLTADAAMARYFETVVAAGSDPKTASNWLMGDVSAYLNSAGLSISESPVGPDALAELIRIIASGKVSLKQGRDVFKAMCETKKDAPTLIAELGMEQISDESALIGVIDEVIAGNEKSVQDFLGGKEKAIGALVGQVMKATKGKANPGVVNKLLVEQLHKRK